MNQIGLKLADGSFYPVLEEGVAGRKRLILTTVRDNQETVQIDLYRGEGVEVEDANYLGSLSIENIPPVPKSDPEIELVLGLDETGTLSASAADLPGGKHERLSLQLGTPLAGPPEFEVEHEGTDAGPDPGSQGFQEDLLTGETYPIGPGDRRKEHLQRRKRSPLLLVAFVVLALILIAAIAFVVFRSMDGRRIPPLFGGRQGVESAVDVGAPQDQPPAAVAPAAAEAAAEEGTAMSAEGASQLAAADTVPPPAEVQRKPPGPAASGGVWYDIRRGDTLWDIAATYYRNPWLYPKIARANQITNPDLIFAGNKLLIPEL